MGKPPFTDAITSLTLFCAWRVAWRVYSNGTLANASAHCSKKRLWASSRSSRISKILLVSSSVASVWRLIPSVMVWTISWATLLFLSREATQYSVAILALSWAILALLSAILPRSSKYVLVIVVVATYRHLRR